MHLEQTVFVERADVREAPEAGFQGLCPGRQVRLKYGPVVQVLQVARGLNGQLQVRARLLEPGEAEEAKGCLHWISRRDAEQVETRLYQRLFLDGKPVQDAQDPADRQRELNPHSLTVRVASLFNREYLGRMKWDNRFQLERLGYFFQDSDSRLGSRVFNLVIDLQHKANC